MPQPEIYKMLEKLPESEGVFCLKGAEKQTLFVGAASNLRKTLSEIFSPAEQVSQTSFQKQTSGIEILQGGDLIKLFAQTLRLQKPVFNASLAGENLYPYLKITREDFPRLLVTRKIADDDADYFGAFLPATGVRFWLEFLNRTFRLRTCDIAIDGNFPSPCTQFYVKRCVAPCVESLCDRKDYLEMVELVRLFLQNEREKFAKTLAEKIEAAAENLEFEKAGAWRDLLQSTNEVFSKKDWQLWLTDAVDTFEIEEKARQVLVYLVTQRGRRTLGKKVFVFEKKLSGKEILADVIWQLYEFHAPREIRVPFDFPNRKLLAEVLSRRENRPVKFTIIRGESNERKTSLQALKRARFDFDFRQIKPPVKTEDVLRELKNLLAISQEPRKIEAFDVAHISGKDFTAAKAVWKNGKFLTHENEFWLLDETSELESLEKALGERFFRSNEQAFPDLLLIDGGKSQLQAALKALSFLKNRRFAIIGAVKPPRRHNEVSHFILENGETIKFSNESEAMRVLLRLRDEAHELANKVHRQRREASHFYELAKILPSLNEGERRHLLQKFGSLKKLSQASGEELEKFVDASRLEIVLKDLKANGENIFSNVNPLIVPIRFDDPNGDAKDLQPLSYQAKSNGDG